MYHQVSMYVSHSSAFLNWKRIKEQDKKITFLIHTRLSIFYLKSANVHPSMRLSLVIRNLEIWI